MLIPTSIWIVALLLANRNFKLIRKMISLWKKYGPQIEFLVIILLIIGNTYMKHSVMFKGLAAAAWLTCLVLYILSERAYWTIGFWFFLIIGLILAINQTFDFISLMK